MRKRMTVLGMAALLAACGGDAPPAAQGGGPTEVTYAPDLGVDLAQMQRTASGVYYQDVQPGSGAVATEGSTAVVHYTGWLPDGSEFDTSRGSTPFSFPVGGGQVIQGWDDGVAGMQVGGQRRLVVPPELGYGAEGAGGVIPPNATLVFDVELLEVA